MRGAKRKGRSGATGGELLEPRLALTVTAQAEFLADSANLYTESVNPADVGVSVVPLYRDFQAGGTYGVFASNNVTLDGNDPDAGQGFTSIRMTSTDTPGSFDLNIGDNANRPRDLTEFGLARAVRFRAKGEADAQQMDVFVFRADNLQGAAVENFALTANWADYEVPIGEDLALGPQDLFSVQFRLPAIGTVRLDDVRIVTEGTDRLRLAQSYLPAAGGPTDTDPATQLGRDINVYPNRAFLYDQAITAMALLATGDSDLEQTAHDIIDAELATEEDGTNGFLNVRNSGHVLLQDGTPREAFSQLKTLGDNSFFGMALLDLYRETSDTQYLTAAREISDWAEDNLKASAALKGYLGGFDASGNAVTYRSTEHNIDFYALNHRLAKILAATDEEASQTYADRATYAGDFVVSVFENGHLLAGTTNGDILNTDSVPLDAQVWALLSLGQSVQYAAAIDWQSVFESAANDLTATDGAITGFTYSSGSTADRVWSEGVASGAVAYRLLDDPQSEAAALAALGDLTDATGGVLAASGELADPAFQAIYDPRAALAPTAWTVFAQLGRNPFGNTEITWHNPINGLDVVDDGNIFPEDAHSVIDSLLLDGAHALPAPTADNMPPGYIDVNNDQKVSPKDAIMVINWLLLHPPEPAGTALASPTVVAAPPLAVTGNDPLDLSSPGDSSDPVHEELNLLTWVAAARAEQEKSTVAGANCNLQEATWAAEWDPLD